MNAPLPPELTGLLVRVGRGDRAAFCALYAELGPRVKGYVTRVCRDATLAEELTQEVMLTVWRRAAGFDPAIGSAEAWVFAIARNRAIDALRRVRAPDERDPCWVPDAPVAADLVVEARQDGARVHAALDALPDGQREVLRQAFFESRSYPEIAEQQGVALGTIKSRARLAFERLRAALAGDDA